jgi:hypothetical protein
MTDSRRTGSQANTFGDAAVDGLLAGGAAGILMAVYLAVAGLVSGDALASLFGRFDPGPSRSALTGILVHLAVAGVYGVVYGLGRRLADKSRRLARWPGWLTGPVYGLLVWIAAESVLLPGTGSPLQQLAPLVFLVAHLLYGLALGVMYARR